MCMYIYNMLCTVWYIYIHPQHPLPQWERLHLWIRWGCLLQVAIKPQSTPRSLKNCGNQPRTQTDCFFLHPILHSETSFKLSWLWLQILRAWTHLRPQELQKNPFRPYAKAISISRTSCRSELYSETGETRIRKIKTACVIIRKLGGQEMETTRPTGEQSKINPKKP